MNRYKNLIARKRQLGSFQLSAVSLGFHSAGLYLTLRGDVAPGFSVLFLPTNKGPRTTDIERFRSIRGSQKPGVSPGACR